MSLRTKIDEFWALYPEFSNSLASRKQSEFRRIADRLEKLEFDILICNYGNAAELVAKVAFVRSLAAAADDSEVVDRFLAKREEDVRQCVGG